MKKKYLGFIEKDSFTLLHYIPLVGFVFLAHYLSVNKFFNLELMTQTNPMVGWFLLAVWYYAFLLVGDQLVHTLFKRH